MHSPGDATVMTHPLPVAGKLPIKTLVARQLPTSINTHTHIHMCSHSHTCSHTHMHVLVGTHTHTYIHAHTRTHTYMYIQIQKKMCWTFIHADITSDHSTRSELCPPHANLFLSICFGPIAGRSGRTLQSSASEY